MSESDVDQLAELDLSHMVRRTPDRSGFVIFVHVPLTECILSLELSDSQSLVVMGSDRV